MPSTPDAEKTARIESDARFTPRYASPEPQFAPGSIIAGRYRIAGILGKGGMGEVYRADDTKLGQPVALKFLPARLARDPILLARLHDEVRHGRQVSHPNVCRIYDIAEWNGAHFVAMEFVDGEDLARLLHRIGRLAHDKAVDIARGIAAGLLAAHAKGILHRDLKPANVMVDSHGDARITDFGLALSATDDQDGDISGTPAYMAPEQLEGAPATVQSDLYALGLVMYELFTGHRAHAAKTFPDRLRELTSEITIPSNHIRDLDPAVERIILRCLARDPAQRPRSAREVIESLPGGDPLAAAMAAGETPSPRIVAAAGSEGSLRRGVAWALFASALVISAISIAMSRSRSISQFVSFDRSPEVLGDRVETIASALGVPTTGRPIVAIYERPEFRDWLMRRFGARASAVVGKGPGPVLFRAEYGVSADESALEPLLATAPGRTSIDLDMSGRLAFLLHATNDAALRPRPLDWTRLLDAAGLTTATLKPVPPTHTPPVPFDARAAWEGTFASSATPIRVHAAAWKGLPVFFQVTGDWSPSGPYEQAPAPMMFALTVSVTLFAIAIVLAWRNFQRRRGDRSGAMRIATAAFLASSASVLLRAGFPTLSDDPLGQVQRMFGWSLFLAAFAYVMYLAMEPYLRQRWPDRLISWSRLLAGRVLDPMVGRDMLIGILGGAAISCAGAAGPLLPGWLGGRAHLPELHSPEMLLGSRHTVAGLLSSTLSGVGLAFLVMSVLVIATIVLRKRMAAVAALFAVTTAPYLLAATVPMVVALVAGALVTYVAARHGLLATAFFFLTHHLLFLFPTVASPWATSLAAITYVVLGALTLAAFRISLGGQSPFGDVLDEA